MIKKGTIKPFNRTVLRAWQMGLGSERSDKTYGSTTETLVKRFQESQSLQDNGTVDESTADAIDLWGQSRLIHCNRITFEKLW